jgi:hypothetical protein
MVFMNSPYRETPKNVLKINQEKCFGLVGSLKVNQISVEVRRFFWVSCFLLPASCLAFWAALLCLLFAQLSALCLLSPKEHFDKGTKKKRENKGKNIKEKIIK